HYLGWPAILSIEVLSKLHRSLIHRVRVMGDYHRLNFVIGGHVDDPAVPRADFAERQEVVRLVDAQKPREAFARHEMEKCIKANQASLALRQLMKVEFVLTVTQPGGL